MRPCVGGLPHFCCSIYRVTENTELQQRTEVLLRQPAEFLERIRDLPLEQQIRRAEQRERALANPFFTEEIGKNGGAAAEGAKRSRLTKRLAEWAEEDEQFQLIKSVFLRATSEGVAEYVQLQAVDKLIQNAHREHEMELKEMTQASQQYDRERAIQTLEREFARLVSEGKLSEVIEGEFEEVEPRAIEAETD